LQVIRQSGRFQRIIEGANNPCINDLVQPKICAANSARGRDFAAQVHFIELADTHASPSRELFAG
jgi:hypothetical protein